MSSIHERGDCFGQLILRVATGLQQAAFCKPFIALLKLVDLDFCKNLNLLNRMVNGKSLEVRN